ncbi:MAG: 5,6-dimethylbenzimidazole synthase [Planctomycetota bacterium]|nr:5,6-dimethylbenzimidazole synthase [Planctomycetota bacterium]
MDHTFPDSWREGVYEAIFRRRDIRSFKPDPVPTPILAKLLQAAHHAPSVGFMQPWNFMVIDDLAVREEIQAHVEEERIRAAEHFDEERREKYLTYKLEGILESPLNICVTCDSTRFGPAVIGRNTIRETDCFSACCAVQNLWLAARAEGIGVGWVSILRLERLREILGIPDHVCPVAYLCVGYVHQFAPKPELEAAGWLPRLPLEEIVFGDHWGDKPAQPLVGALAETGAQPASGVNDV